MSDVRTRSEAGKLRLQPSTEQDQSVGANVYMRRLDGLMDQMADRAGVGRRVDMVMPDSSNRHPYHERKNRYRKHQAPDSLLISLFEAHSRSQNN